MTDRPSPVRVASWNLWWRFRPWQRHRDAIWPITEQASQPLPAGDGADDGRTVLFARIQTPTGPLPFFTTQLTSTIGHSQVRCRQVAALSRFVADHLNPGFPPVVTGDLNAEPDADEIRLLGGHKTAPVLGSCSSSVSRSWMRSAHGRSCPTGPSDTLTTGRGLHPVAGRWPGALLQGPAGAG